MTAYDEANKAIAAGRAQARALWVLLTDEQDRDRFALKPMPWEGAGEYQHVEFNDGRSGFIRIPAGCRALPCTNRSTRRHGTVDEPPSLAMNQKASIVADAALFARMKLEQEHGRKGDLQTLARLVNVPMPTLATLYDKIAAAAFPHPQKEEG